MFKLIKKRGFTLIELIVVVILIGILSSLAYPVYIRKSEHARDREAAAVLKLIKAAENMHMWKEGGAYPHLVGNAEVNQILSLDLPQENVSNWRYGAQTSGEVDVRANVWAQRINSPRGYERTLRLELDGDAEPCCSGDNCARSLFAECQLW